MGLEKKVDATISADRANRRSRMVAFPDVDVDRPAAQRPSM